MAAFEIKIWKSAPLIRLIVPLILGIVFQYYFQISYSAVIGIFIALLAAIVIFSFTPIGIKYNYRWLQGCFILLLITCLGMWLVVNINIKNNSQWFGNNYNDSSFVLLKITDPPIEKENSYKSIASVVQITNNNIKQNVIGNILIYFSKKDSGLVLPKFGDYVLINGGLQKIKNAGNLGGFDYSRYMSFQQIQHQVFLKPNKFIITNLYQTNYLYNFIYAAQAKVLTIVKNNIKGDNKITGIVEALLIGYKEDLDKDLVQAYSNTGVVHIIAISGMHLGLIYIVLVWIFARLPFIKRSKVLQLVLILAALWLFSLITGASASVLRSAVMFTSILIGKTFFKQASIYNSLATSAFILLCYNPYILWDVGFQLSYTAVIGIVWLQKPLENLYYSNNWLVRNIWKMCSITIAAQILTLPICIYYFHQIPVMFLFTNLVCVPISTIILFAEILLIIVSAIKPLALLVGKVIYFLTWLMNEIIYFFNTLPGSLIDSVHANIYTTLLLYCFVFLICAAMLRKNKQLFKWSMILLFLFTSAWSIGKIKLTHQQKIIVYNVSKHKAIDFVSQKNYMFYGDSTLEIDGALQNFNLKPSRVLMQVNKSNSNNFKPLCGSKLITFYNKKILFIENEISLKNYLSPIKVDAVVLSKNAKITILQISSVVTPNIIVIDGSNSLWKITQWKKECEELHLQHFITSEEGAFVLNAH
jgi:competence protein ComEC